MSREIKIDRERKKSECEREEVRERENKREEGCRCV